MDTPKKVSPAIAALIVIILIGASTAAVAMFKDGGDAPTESSTQSTSTATDSTTTTPPTTTSTYKSGTYTSTGSYLTPGGRESIALTVTLQDGVIEDVNLDQQASERESKEYQSKFASGYKAQVVGKNINDVKLSRVAGSSLTSNGFNDALDKIKQDATS